MSKVTNTKIVEDIVVIATEGYLNKDLGEEIQNIAQKYIDDGSSIFLINLKDSKIVNSIGASILIELIEVIKKQLIFRRCGVIAITMATACRLVSKVCLFKFHREKFLKLSSHNTLYNILTRLDAKL